jgi:hypothetical protein
MLQLYFDRFVMVMIQVERYKSFEYGLMKTIIDEMQIFDSNSSSMQKYIFLIEGWVWVLHR